MRRRRDRRLAAATASESALSFSAVPPVTESRSPRPGPDSDDMGLRVRLETAAGRSLPATGGTVRLGPESAETKSGPASRDPASLTRDNAGPWTLPEPECGQVSLSAARP